MGLHSEAFGEMKPRICDHDVRRAGLIIFEILYISYNDKAHVMSRSNPVPWSLQYFHQLLLLTSTFRLVHISPACRQGQTH
jgi:hypothetical protein